MGGDMEEMQPLRACSALFGKEVEDFLLMATVHHVAIESMFNEYDVDGSGSLDVHEVQALAQRLHIEMDAAKVRSHLNLLRGSWNPEPKALLCGSGIMLCDRHRRVFCRFHRGRRP